MHGCKEKMQIKLLGIRRFLKKQRCESETVVQMAKIQIIFNRELHKFRELDTGYTFWLPVTVRI